MPENYTPTATYGVDPVIIPVNGDAASATTAFSPVKECLNRAAYLKVEGENTEGRLDAGLTKLGITVVNPSDTTPPTYSSGYLLSGSQTHHSALETLDSGIQVDHNSLVNTYTNVGGNVQTGSPDSYSSTNFITNGDTHHTALGKIDNALNVVNTNATSANTQATANTTKIINIVSKLGDDADQSEAWTYDSINFITNGVTLKVNTEMLDKVLLGTRRTAHRSYWLAVERNLKALGISDAETYWDDFYDSSKYHVNTTCVVDTNEQVAYTDNTVLIETYNASNTHSQFKFEWWGEGTITVYANLIGDLTGNSDIQITAQDTWFTPASTGSNFVVRFELGLNAKLFNYYALMKP